MAFNREKVISSAEKYVSKGKIEAGIKEYRKVLAENPNDANTLNRVGDLYARIERIDEAVKLFTQIAEQYTNDGFFVKAIAIYKKIIKLDPTSLQVYERLAELYHKQGLLNEARTQYQVLADYYQKHDNAASAISIFQRMAEMEPDNPSFRLKLADLYASQRLIEKALREYQVLAELMIEEGTADETAQVYFKAFEIHQAGDLEFVQRAFNTLNAKDAAVAERVLLRAVELNPTAAELKATLLAPPEPEPAPPETSAPETFAPETTEPIGVESGFGAFPSELASDIPAQDDDGAFSLTIEPDGTADSFDFGEIDIEMDAESPAEDEDVFTLDLGDDEVPDTLVTPPTDIDDAPATASPVSQDDEFEFVIEGFDDDQPDTLVTPPADMQEPAMPASAAAGEEIEIDWGLDEMPVPEVTAPEMATPEMPAEVTPEITFETGLEIAAEEVAEVEIVAAMAEPEIADLSFDMPEATVEPEAFEISFEDVAAESFPVDEVAIQNITAQEDAGAAQDIAPQDIATPEVPAQEFTFQEVDLEDTVPPALGAPELPAGLAQDPQFVDSAAAPFDGNMTVQATPPSLAETPAAFSDAPDGDATVFVSPTASEVQAPALPTDPSPPSPPGQPTEVEWSAEAGPPSQPFEAAPPTFEMPVDQPPELPADIMADAGLPRPPASDDALPPQPDLSPPQVDVQPPAPVAPPQAGVQAPASIDLGFSPPETTASDLDATHPSVLNQQPASPPIDQQAPPPIDQVEPVATGGVSPAVQRREDDLLAEAEVFFKYGLRDKSRDRLEELLDLNPTFVRGLKLLVDIELKDGQHDAVIARANEIARLASDHDDHGQWPVLRDQLTEAGFKFEGGTFVSAPKTSELPSDNRIAQLLEDLDTEEPAAAPVAATAAPSSGAPKKISLIDELGLDGLDDFDEEEDEAAMAMASTPATEDKTSDADLLDETGMSWLDDPPSSEQASDQVSEAYFDDEDDFFDLAAELQRELGDDELPEVETAVPQEQTLEEIIDGFKKGVAENLSAEDYDTHFNLGIAYREMGLLDEAIGEFQLASKDERYLIDCSSLLGLCFLEKGLPELALKWYRRGLEAPNIEDEATLGLLYDMGSAYVSLGDSDAALKTFVEIYGINSNYRDVSSRVQELRQG